MKSPRTRATRTIDAAEKVASVLASLGIESAVIGAMALASHKYVRNTNDFDLATCANVLVQLPAAKKALEKEEFEADLRLPDAEDPLGGVLRLNRRGIRRHRDRELPESVRPGCVAPGRRVHPHGFSRGPARGFSPCRRFAASHRAQALRRRTEEPERVIELLERNAPLDLVSIGDTCARHGLEAPLKAILAELRLG